MSIFNLQFLAINEADYVNVEKVKIKKEKDDDAPSTSNKKRKGEEDSKSKSKAGPAKGAKKETPADKKGAGPAKKGGDSKTDKKGKTTEKDEDELKGLEEMYYGIMDGHDENYESFPYKKEKKTPAAPPPAATEDGAEVPPAPEPIEDEDDFTIYPSYIECPICDTSTTFDSNEKLQTHLVSHLNIDGKDHNLQCLFCLEKMDTETVLTKHNNIMHPEETKSSNSASYRCLICQQRFNSLNFLTSHLQNKHSMLELPYYCQACGYRTSSHRDVVRHYYDDHKHQNFLQCPYCLDVSSEGPS